MSLEVYNNRTENTHENEQFRRVVKIIERTFEKNGYEGILIGNPEAEVFPQFQSRCYFIVYKWFAFNRF